MREIRYRYTSEAVETARLNIVDSVLERCRLKMREAGADLKKCSYEILSFKRDDKGGWERCHPQDAEMFEMVMREELPQDFTDARTEGEKR